MKARFHTSGDETKLNQPHGQIRGVLRILGPIVLVVGVLSLIVALIDFITSIGQFRVPYLFIIGGFGALLIPLGIFLTTAGYMGAIARYQSAEIAPVGKDTFNYLADGTKIGVATLTQAAGQGLRAGLNDPTPKLTCPTCDSSNEPNSRFCDQCGQQLTITCPTCQAENAADSKYCDQCGRALV